VKPRCVIVLSGRHGVDATNQLINPIQKYASYESYYTYKRPWDTRKRSVNKLFRKNKHITYACPVLYIGMMLNIYTYVS